MITLEKLRTYQEFNGELDGWARASKSKSEPFMTDADWYLIDELLMGLTAIEAGLASPAFARELETKVRASTVDEATRAALRTLVVRPRPDNAA